MLAQHNVEKHPAHLRVFDVGVCSRNQLIVAALAVLALLLLPLRLLADEFESVGVFKRWWERESH